MTIRYSIYDNGPVIPNSGSIRDFEMALVKTESDLITALDWLTAYIDNKESILNEMYGGEKINKVKQSIRMAKDYKSAIEDRLALLSAPDESTALS